MLCSSAAPSVIACFKTTPIPAAAIAFFIPDANLLPADFPALSPASSASAPSSLANFPFIPLATGIICTYASASLIFPPSSAN